MKRILLVLVALVIFFTTSAAKAALELKCSATTGTDEKGKVVSQSELEREVLNRADIDQILAAVQDPTVTNVYLYALNYCPAIDDIELPNVIIEYSSQLWRVFGAVPVGGLVSVYYEDGYKPTGYTRSAFLHTIYSVKAKKIADAAIIDGSFTLAQVIDNNAGLPVEKHESKRSGRLTSISMSGKYMTILQYKKATYEIPLCEVNFSSNRHPAELATLNALQEQICGPKPTPPAKEPRSLFDNPPCGGYHELNCP